MHHFFVSKEEIGEGEILLRGENFHHLHKVLRGQIGEKILISDGEGVDYQCEIQSFSEDEASLSICFREEPHELPAKLILLQALPKGDKMEWIIQKAVELGISALIPLESKNTVMKLKEKKEEKKISRWQSIMDAAAKQSKRSILPKMENGMGWKEAFSYVKDCDFKLLPYENERGVVPTREILSKMEEAVKGKKRLFHCPLYRTGGRLYQGRGGGSNGGGFSSHQFGKTHFTDRDRSHYGIKSDYDAVGICSSGVRPEGEEDEKYLFGQCSQYQGISGSGGFDDHYHAGRLRKPVSKAQDGRGSGSLLS